MAAAQVAGGRFARPPRRAHRWSAARGRRSSLYVRVVTINAAVLVAAVLLLLLTPVTVSSRVSTGQALILVVAVLVMVAADAALLKVTFRGLAMLGRRMRTLDVLRSRERLPEVGGRETRALISGFNAMIDRLEDERRASARGHIAKVEGERQRISRELHDEIGQRTTGILLQLSSLRNDVPEGAAARVARLQDEARALMDEVGALAWRVRPAILDNLGLLAALRALASSLTNSGVRIDAILPDAPPDLDHDVELAVYRIAQEAVTNAVRHAGARVITVRMTVSATDLLLQVCDDGQGLGTGSTEGSGLRGMRERTLLIDGRLVVGARFPRGVQVELSLPMTARTG